MRTTLIALTPPDVSAFGTRALSAYLKKHGKDVRIIFLPGGVEKYKYQKGYQYEYEKLILEQIIELGKESGLIGISFMSNYLARAMQICQAIKISLDVPVIVGGIHPTVSPEECLRFSDMVCIGEGEETLLELIEKIETGKNYDHIQNLYVKRAGKIYKNPLRPLIRDLDQLPFYDFGTDKQYIYDNVKKKIEPLSKELIKRSFPLEPHLEGSFNDSYKRTLSYKTMTTRGCPHHCTFCAEKTLSDLYKGQGYLRKRGISHIMEELVWVKRELPFVESIFPFDDTFLVRSTKEIIEFSKSYKELIGLPFHIQASPTTVTPEKMEVLIDAGLVFVEMGIQSTSNTAKNLYKRWVSEEAILKASDVFQKYKNKIYPPCYHVILDNPWETSTDVIETLNTVLKLRKPFWLKRASLVCFPGTELYDKAKQDGIFRTEEDEWENIYSKHLHTPKGTYINFLMYLAGFSSFPRWIIKLLSKSLFLRLFDRKKLSSIYTLMYRFGEMLIVLSKGLRSFIKGDFSRIYQYVIKITSKTS